MKNYVKTYSNFTKRNSINESYRPIEEDEFNRLIDTSYTFLNSDFKPDFYRGMDSLEKLILIKTDDHTRYSKGADKITAYNYWIDNSDEWENYPKRSKGIICCNKRGVAEDYGNLYKILPLQKPELFKAGVCPVSDVWHSFMNGGLEAFEKDGYININYHFIELSVLVDSLNIRFNDFFELLDVIQEKFVDPYSIMGQKENDALNKPNISDTIRHIINYCGRHNLNIREQYDIFFNPKINGFELLNYSNIKSFYDKLKLGNTRQSREIWFEGPAIAVLLEDY